MKNLKLPLVLFMTLIFMILQSCKKDPLDKLPPFTTVGANTFGCLVNGEVFTPKVNFQPTPALETNFEPSSNGTFLSIKIENKKQGSKYMLLIINEKELENGKSYTFKEKRSDGSYATYTVLPPKELEFKDYVTTDKATGKVDIKYFDRDKRIIAGTFFFDAVNEQGVSVKVTDGRFDLSY